MRVAILKPLQKGAITALAYKLAFLRSQHIIHSSKPQSHKKTPRMKLFAALRLCGFAALRLCGFAALRLCSFANLCTFNN